MSAITALHPAHLALHARMVDFGGWEMPLNYGSQIEEHHAVRRDCGLFDISHMLAIDVAGQDAQSFLQYLLANNVAKLRQAGKALYSCMLDDSGGVLDDLIVYYLDDTHYRLVVNAATADKDVAWIRTQSAASCRHLQVEPRRDLAMIAIQGPNSRTTTWRAIPGIEAYTAAIAPFFAVQQGRLFVARTGYTGEDGFELTCPIEDAEGLWNTLLQAGARPCGLGARDTLRLEAGMALYGQDMDKNVSPLDAGLEWSVDFGGERAFIGKPALLARVRTTQALGLVLDDAGGILRAHQKVQTAAGEGLITSGSFSPTMQVSIGLARLPLDIAIGDRVEVDIRGKVHPARVVKPPFVRNGRILV